jgi:hypothetical protein
VFIYEPDAGALEIIARGGKAVQLPLRRAFCQAVLDLTVEDTDPIRRSYELDHLLDPSFSFTTEPEDRITAVRLRRVRVVPVFNHPTLEGCELRLRETAGLAEVRAAVIKFCTAFGLTPSQLHVVQAGIQIEFQSDGRRHWAVNLAGLMNSIVCRKAAIHLIGSELSSPAWLSIAPTSYPGRNSIERRLSRPHQFLLSRYPK